MALFVSVRTTATKPNAPQRSPSRAPVRIRSMVFPPSSSPSRSVRSADTPVVPRQSDWTSQKGRFSEVFPTFLASPLLLISNQTADGSAARAARGHPSVGPIANLLSRGSDYHIAL